MHELATIVGQIFDHFHEVDAFFREIGDDEPRYAQYYTSMYLLQDATESLLHHREHGFSTDPYAAYIELWGVLQATYIQQDALSELHKAIVGHLNTETLGAWKRLRDLRNELAGHPAKRDRPKGAPLTRTFVGRRFGGYSCLTYERWVTPTSSARLDDPFANIKHTNVNLGEILDEYADEAAAVAERVFTFMETKWPRT